jgi:hypothetical protein
LAAGVGEIDDRKPAMAEREIEPRVGLGALAGPDVARLRRDQREAVGVGAAMCEPIQKRAR